MNKQTQGARNAILLYAILLVVWGFYRTLFKLPESVEELVLKPAIWLLPMVYFYRQEGASLSSIGWTAKGLFRSIYLSLGLGIIFVVVAYLSNVAKYQGATFSDFGLSGATLFSTLSLTLITAIVEETVFRGYIFTRIWDFLKNEITSNLLVSAGWGIIHLPVLVFVYHLSPMELATRFLLTVIFGFGSAFVFAKTRNIASAVGLHILWSWPIILFR